MDFSLSTEQKDIMEAARKFAQTEFPKVARECDRAERYPKEMWEKAGELGFMGIFIPEEYGGLGLGVLEHALVMEEFWRADPGVGCILLAVFGAEIITAFGTEEQKQRYLPGIAGGEKIWGTAITEANAGSDIFGQASTAAPTETGYRLNGSKQFISNGTVADHVLVMAMTDPKAENRSKRFSFLVVDRGQPGFEATKISGKMGIRASDTASLSFDDVDIPAANLIGPQGGPGFSPGHAPVQHQPGGGGRPGRGRGPRPPWTGPWPIPRNESSSAGPWPHSRGFSIPWRKWRPRQCRPGTCTAWPPGRSTTAG